MRTTPQPGLPLRRRRGVPVVAGVAGLLALSVVGFVFGPQFGRRGLSFAGGPAGSRAQRGSALTVVQTLNSQIALYKLQHNGSVPDFAAYPDWVQLTQYTDSAGRPSATRGGGAVIGPYLQRAPANPLNGMGTVLVVDGPPAVGDPLPAGGAYGFVFCAPTGRIYATDVQGARVVDPGAADAWGNR